MRPGTIDRRAVARAFGRASARYESAAHLQSRVREELLSRLVHFRPATELILDLGAGTAAATPRLRTQWPDTQVVAVDLAPEMLRQAGAALDLWDRWFDWRRRKFHRVAADAVRLPFRDHSVGFVFSNLMLQWCDDLDSALAEIRRVLVPGGTLLLSTFGPLTLRELREAWASVDDVPRVNDFVDLHDLGSALVRAGFAEPVLDVDRILEWHADPRALMQSLREIGAVNAAPDRRRGLTGRRALGAMETAYRQRARADGRIPATWEVLFASAFAASPAQAPQAPAEVHVPTSAIGRRGVR